MSKFVHLHLHTQYSVLDGAMKIEDLIAKAKEFGQGSVAMTDHGNMHGAIDFYEEATDAGLKPIIGCEVYITTGSRFDRSPKAQGGPSTHHLTLLAQNQKGYTNLCKLVTAGFTEGFYFRPRVDHELLSELSDGIICLSGCLSGEFAEYAKRGELDRASAHIEKYLKIFGDRYYLEVQPHNLLEQQNVNRVARELGDKLGVPLVATNDCHYVSPDDHYAQEVLMCVSTAKLITDPDRIKHDGVLLHLKDHDEMCQHMHGFEDAICRTTDIAARCNLEFDFGIYHMPKFAPPEEETIESYFASEARSGMALRFKEFEEKERQISPQLRQAYDSRLEEEIKLILEMGFAGYFLVVSDFIRWAKRADIPVGPGRGSAAGSLVAYVMFITEIDPIEYNLLFERFLNPERISLPDIDVDFCIFGRDKVIDYVCNKYGKDKVAQIVTFGTLKAKAAIKDVGRVLGLSYAETDRIAKLIPAPRQGFDYPISEALKMEKRLRDYADGEGKELITLAQKLEGLTRHTSTHAAGLVIADRPVVELLPLMQDKDGQVVTQFSMHGVEKIGLVKFDFLGLKTLTVLHEAVRLIKEAKNIDVNLNALPLKDPATYKLCSLGKTVGIFQLESGGLKEMLMRLKPSCFEDLVAILALYRPGPLDAGMAEHFINRKHGREPVRYLHPLLEKILKDTYGIILYQEQIMQIARDMAGYSLGEADMLRRAMGKKKPEEMAKQREIFVNGSIKRGVAEKIASEVFGQMETFARYGFNRSHSVAYAMISFQTAYLKAHYTVYFMAALMTFEMSDTDKTLKNLSECREMGIDVIPPDVNRGAVGFNVVEGRILFGLAAIKGVGEKAVEKIISERNTNGDFKSLYDFCRRVEGALLNRRTLENLIKAGAFEWTKQSRADLMDSLEDVLKLAQRERANEASNQISLFGDALNSQTTNIANRSSVPEWPVNIKLAHEKDALGFYLSGHPLEKFRFELQRFGAQTTETIKSANDGAEVRVAGVITFMKLKNTKKGDRYATFVLEDLYGTQEVIVWPDTYQTVYASLVADDPVLVQGRLDVSDERRTLIASGIESAIQLRDKSAKEAVVMLDSRICSGEKLEKLKGLLAQHHGRCPVKLVLRKAKHSEIVVSLPNELSIEPSEALCNRVEQLFGEPVLTFR